MTSKMLTIITACLIGIIWSLPAVATSKHKRSFTTYYEHTKRTKLDSCNTCHTGNPMSDDFTFNPYGNALRTWMDENDTDDITIAFAGIESEDSDEDTHFNIDEVNALTFPGDGTDHPTE